MKNGSFLIEMGKKIKAIREEQGVSLRQLGKMCELDYSSISRIECGQYSSRVLTLKIIAEQLGVDIKDFL